ncbi:MAG: N-acetylmannosamine-6-phosphate 2-epimerase [Armatimonadota bacterium]|nr:N-acetylmannosamine-6-phosphate 2-epimerase [Armatimonadota bacterium]
MNQQATNKSVIESLKGGLIVSCQAGIGTPLHGPKFMAGMAKAAEMGGAVGIRADGPVDIRAIKEAVRLPVIGIYKIHYPDAEPYITPTYEAAEQIAAAGADIIALDATNRPHPGDTSADELISRVKQLNLPIMADISTAEEGIAAAEAGADLISTTLSGYTPYSRQTPDPDFQLIEELVKVVNVPVIAEGKIWTPEQARRALDAGAYAVVVGTAITRPWIITERFVKALREAKP